MRATLVGEQARRQGGIQWDTRETKTEFLCPFTGKPIYRKAVDFGLLPNTGAGTKAHGITGLNVAEGAYLRLDGQVSDGTTVEDLKLAANVSIFSIDAANVNITTGADLSSSRGLIFIEYTKA
jgi:hypothetical protein